MDLMMQHAILRSVSEGKLSWRVAIEALELKNFEELQQRMQENALPLFEPNPEHIKQRRKTVDALLYGNEEVS